MHSDPTIVSRTLRIGATGYVLKDDRYDEVFRAFECVRDGKTYMSSELALRMARSKNEKQRTHKAIDCPRATDAGTPCRRQAI
jgi:DNA-binding NarL/FixJ family response regulator